jgi:hypothetical protein
MASPALPSGKPEASLTSSKRLLQSNPLLLLLLLLLTLCRINQHPHQRSDMLRRQKLCNSSSCARSMC